MPQLTFARLMSVVLGVIGLFTAIKFVMAVGAAYTDYRNVSRMATASSLVTAWERGTVALSLERSVMQVALAVETPVSADLRGLIDAQRAQAEADFREALDLSSSDALKELRGPFSEAAQKSFGAIGGLRTEVDAMLAVPKAARDPKRIYNLPLEMKGEISGMKNASALVSPENSVSSNLSIGLTAIQNRAWEVREFGGRARTYFAIAVLNRTAISENELGAVLADSQRAAAAWQAIRYVGEANTLPQNLVEQIDIGNRLYFDDYIALTETLIAASQRATSETVDYPIEFPEFFATSNEALDHMTALSQLSGEELLQYWMQRQDSALLQLAVNAVLAGIVISIIGCFIWLLNRRVIMRLETTTSALEKLSSGTLDVVISRKPNDLMEIGRLTDALENFRTSLTEAEEAKARAARQSADARTAVMTQMKKEFGSAVDMAVQGDFSARVVASFEEQEIAELASGINRLMSFLDENIAATNDLMQRVAEGNFTGRLEGEFPGALGDLQKSINMTLDRLSQLVREIATAGESMRLTVDGIEDVAERLAESATKQAASVEETSATIEQFSASIRSNAQDSTQAATLANQSTARANSGSGIVENTVSAMEEIQSGSQKVKEIVSVIDGISFQTNLLALNAAVESARAGEAGKGFSVVASEVRGLAQRSASAASDIRELIDTTVASVDSGVDLASQTGSSFAEIMTSISELEGAVSSIVDTNSRQSSSIEEINSAVRKIDKITQDTAGMAARSSSTAKKLSEDTQKLLSLIAFFKVRDDAADPSRLAG